MERPAPVDDSDSLEPVFDKWGKVKFVARQQAPEQVASEAAGDDGAARDGGNAGFGVPPLPGQQAAPSTEVTALQSQVEQLTQAVGLLLQAQAPGAAKPEPPAAPTPPDPTQFDFFDPQQFAEWHKQNAAYTDALVQHRVNAALEPHGRTLEDAKWQTQYNTVAAQHGNDPNFQANANAALQLVAKHKDKFTIPEAYEIVSSLQPSPSPQQQPGAPSPRPQQPARTITTQQADAMAEKAKRLPTGGNGVSSAGRPALPANIRTLGAIMAWNKQHGRA